MPRWRQVYNEETGKSEFIPIDEAARRADGGQHYIHGDIDSFVSPVDGSVISDRKQLEEHNRRHGVVSAHEFSPEFYARKAEERARLYSGEYTKQESLRRKQEINEIINRLERR